MTLKEKNKEETIEHSTTSPRQQSHKTSLSIQQFCMASGATPRPHPGTPPSLLAGEMAERKTPE